MYKYLDWTKDSLCKAEKDLNMTINEIRKERKDNDASGLDAEQVDMMRDCLEGLHYIYCLRVAMHDNQAKMITA